MKRWEVELEGNVTAPAIKERLAEEERDRLMRTIEDTLHLIGALENRVDYLTIERTKIHAKEINATAAATLDFVETVEHLLAKNKVHASHQASVGEIKAMLKKLVSC